MLRNSMDHGLESNGSPQLRWTMRNQLRRAIRDVIDGTLNWRPWYVLGISEIRQRYRRSLLGPFWVTLTMGVQAFVMGVLLSFLFKIEIQKFLPFVCVGLVTWAFISSSLAEGASAFIAMSSAITQVHRPLWTYVMLVLWRNGLIYAHTLPVFFVTAFLMGIFPSWTYLLIPAGLALLVINAAWMALAAGILSARFRDVPMIISNALNVLVWLTPVYYHPDQLGANTRTILQFNPLTSIIEVARAPFLNQVPPLWVWATAAGIALFGWMLTLALFARARRRIPFWV
jgi:lipopolysaccharide transport system permease protein